MEEIKFSIILPTRNRAYCINKMLDSILSQTYDNYEIICIDDASTDNTEDFIKSHYHKEIAANKLRYVRLATHKGVSGARNDGLSRAANPWICYADSDNVMMVDFLMTYKDLIKENPAAKCFYTKLRYQGTTKTQGRHYSWQTLCAGNYIDLGVFVHHLSLYKELGGFDEKLKRLVDWDLILRYTRKYPPVFSPKVTLEYNNGDDPSRISNRENFQKSLKIIRKRYPNKITSKGAIMTTGLLKTMRLLHLIDKEKYNQKRYVELVKASPLFDTRWYLAQNPDVKARKISAARHYVKFGWKEGRNPSPKFDNNAYLAEYEDVAAAGLCPLVHYLISGSKEGRYYQSVDGVQGESSGAGFGFSSLKEKLKYALEYPIRLQEECDRLQAEIKALENTK